MTTSLLRFTILTIALCALLPASAAHAQENARIAVVDLDALFFSAVEGRDLRASLADLEKETKDQVEQIGIRIQTIRQGAAGKPPTEQREAARQIEDAEIEARRVADSAKRRAAKIEQDARDKYNERLEPLLRELQEEEGFDLILNKAPGVVVFASAAVDISQALLAKLEASGG